MLKLLIIGSAGFAGAIARFGVHSLFGRFGIDFPLGTLVINVLGSFALGCLIGSDAGRGVVPEYVRLMIGVGFLGAFTTFSTFSAEGDQLLRDGRAWTSVGYLAASVVLGVIAARGGYMLCR